MCNTLSSYTHTKEIFGVFLYYKIIHLENSKHQTGQPKSLVLTMAAVFEPEVLFMFACMYPWLPMMTPFLVQILKEYL